MKKKRIAVLMGGKSAEHEISLISGREVVKNLDKSKYKVYPVLVSKKGVFKLPKNIDVVFIALHGPFGEDGSVQGMLELLGVPYTGSGVLSSALGMDKLMFRELMGAKGIRVPKQTSKIPCFVKPYNQGSSVGASIVKSQKELGEAVIIAKKYSDKVLIEEYIEGTEITCAVMGNDKPYVLPLIEIVPKNKFFDYESKYKAKETQEIIPARISKSLTKKVQDLAIKVYKDVGCRGFGRVDFILRDEKEPVVLEINTIPGLTAMSLFPKAAKAAGITYPKLLDKIIYYALQNLG